MASKEDLKHILRELKTRGDPARFKEKAAEFLKNVDAKTLSMAEQELMEEGMSQEELRGLCDVHLEVLRQGEAITSTCRETKVAYSNHNSDYDYD